MTRYVAFLRGINLGKRRVKMADLRRHVEALGFDGVGTFIASGNVIFDHDAADPSELEARIEEHLEDAVGFFTDTMIRPITAVARMTGLDLVEEAEADGFTPFVTFAKSALDADVERAFRSLETPDDRFHLLDGEVLWLRRGRLTDSSIKTNDLEKAFGGVPNTRRKIRTLRRLVEKFGR